MKKAIIKKPFTTVQWHGEEYPYYESDAEENAFNKGDEVEILKEFIHKFGKMYVIFKNENSNVATVHESYLKI